MLRYDATDITSIFPVTFRFTSFNYISIFKPTFLKLHIIHINLKEMKYKLAINTYFNAIFIQIKQIQTELELLK